MGQALCLFFVLGMCWICDFTKRPPKCHLPWGLVTKAYTFMGHVYTPSEACDSVGGILIDDKICTSFNLAKVCVLTGGTWNNEQCTVTTTNAECKEFGDGGVYKDGKCTIDPRFVPREICITSLGGKVEQGECIMQSGMALKKTGLFVSAYIFFWEVFSEPDQSL
ncbi:hypothetical protein K505DRAFT_363138 [Melanomma pulvis-pyrius CBS 109.77]|uniref:Uncharacterized protein n=1 Tax=Melanomma pulvis-pyrius CBS 109.77 TaxID=1314802 RepID=A0A6A6X7G6_9PLEO|nr:hypothetical protein K505DRAFT_363138 [Melanomma pulvis-pyrius CBS 109.77]